MTTLETKPIAFFFSPFSPGAEPVEESDPLGAGTAALSIPFLSFGPWPTAV